MGGFKGLTRSDVYLTDYVSKKHWIVSDSEFEDLGVEMHVASSSSTSPYILSDNYKSNLLYRNIDKSFYGSTDHWHVSSSCNNCNKCITYLNECPVHLTLSELKNSGSNACIDCGVCSEIVRRDVCLQGAFFKKAQTSTEHFIGGQYSTFDLENQSTLTISGSRILGERALVLSIPKRCFGTSLEDNSIKLSGTFGEIKDLEGVLVLGNDTVGDVIYTKGLLIITDESLIDSITGSNLSLEFTSMLPIFTYNINCVVKDQECNYTYNPTAKALQESGSEFTPYISSVGLYNNVGELLAVAKVSKPIKKAPNIDTTFRIQIDI